MAQLVGDAINIGSVWGSIPIGASHENNGSKALWITTTKWHNTKVHFCPLFIVAYTHFLQRANHPFSTGGGRYRGQGKCGSIRLLWSYTNPSIRAVLTGRPPLHVGKRERTGLLFPRAGTTSEELSWRKPP